MVPKTRSQSKLDTPQTFHSPPRLPLELQIQIITYAAMPFRKPVAIYAKIPGMANWTLPPWRITHYIPVTGPNPKLSKSYIVQLGKGIQPPSKRDRWGNSMNEGMWTQDDTPIVAVILRANGWFNSRNCMENPNRQRDTLRLEYSPALLWTSRLTRKVALEVWRELVMDVDVQSKPLGGLALWNTKVEVLRQLNVLIERLGGLMKWSEQDRRLAEEKGEQLQANRYRTIGVNAWPSLTRT